MIHKSRFLVSTLVLCLVFTLFAATSVNSFAASKVSISKATITLGTTSYTYTGKALNPSVTVKYKGKTLKKGTHYTVSYTNNVNVGTARVTVKGKGNYTGSVQKSYTIKPKGTTCTCVIGQIEVGGPQVHVEWKAQKTQTTGYSVELLNTKTNKLTGYATGTNSQTVMNIKANKNTNYKVRIRTYKRVNGKTYFSSYSKWYSCKTLI